MGTHPRSGVFLDRDGVLNDVVVREGKSYPPPSEAALVIYPEVPGALRTLARAGLPLVVVTNQPDVGRGTQTREAVEAIHAVLRERLPLDAIEVCFHVDEDACGCRKPAPGLLESAARRLGIDLGASFLVGDRWRDIEAGQRVGCTTFWIDRGYRERQPDRPDHVVSNVAEAARIILARIDARQGRARPDDARERASHSAPTRGNTTCDAS